MAINYQTAASQLMLFIDKAYGGIGHYEITRYTGMLPEDFSTLLANYKTYASNPIGYAGYTVQVDASNQVVSDPGSATGYGPTFEARPASFELYPGSHGANETTFSTGTANQHS